MNNWRITILLLLCPWGLLAQSPGSTHQLDSLKSLLAGSDLSGPTRMDLLNEIGRTYWIINPDSSLYYGHKARELALQINKSKGLSQGERIIGVAYWAQGNSPMALQYLSASNAGFTKSNDLEGIANTWLNIGMVYADIGRPETAMDYYAKALTAFRTLALQDRIATCYTKMADIYLEKGKMGEAKNHLMAALDIHTENAFAYGMAEVHNRLGMLYLKINDLELAYNHAQMSVLTGSNLSDIDGLTRNQLLMAQINLRENRLDLAENNLQTALAHALKNHLKQYEIAAQKGLMELKSAQQQPLEALGFAQRYIQLKDSLSKSHQEVPMPDLHKPQQVAERDALLALPHTPQEIPWTLIVGTLVLSLLCLTSILLVFQRKVKRNHALLEDQRDYLQTKITSAEHTIDILKTQKMAQNKELEHKKEELVAYALQLAHAKETFKSIQSKISTMKMAKAETMENAINHIEQYIENHMHQGKDWEVFKKVMETAHSNFYAKLKLNHPELTANDLKMCSLIRLSLNIRETANLLGIAPESVKTARHRLRKKLNLPPNLDLMDHLFNIAEQ